ncbi:hypothetical protein NMY22_g8594 [Coprinellus aureogranulatus]|nr:hypothetical protein NMY22_g8594 [Coprinellus aureogranulatus]
MPAISSVFPSHFLWKHVLSGLVYRWQCLTLLRGFADRRVIAFWYDLDVTMTFSQSKTFHPSFQRGIRLEVTLLTVLLSAEPALVNLPNFVPRHDRHNKVDADDSNGLHKEKPISPKLNNLAQREQNHTAFDESHLEGSNQLHEDPERVSIIRIETEWLSILNEPPCNNERLNEPERLKRGSSTFISRNSLITYIASTLFSGSLAHYSYPGIHSGVRNPNAQPKEAALDAVGMKDRLVPFAQSLVLWIWDARRTSRRRPCDLGAPSISVKRVFAGVLPLSPSSLVRLGCFEVEGLWARWIHRQRHLHQRHPLPYSS